MPLHCSVDVSMAPQLPVQMLNVAYQQLAVAALIVASVFTCELVGVLP
jgi:hypothetical protein